MWWENKIFVAPKGQNVLELVKLETRDSVHKMISIHDHFLNQAKGPIFPISFHSIYDSRNAC